MLVLRGAKKLDAGDEFGGEDLGEVVAILEDPMGLGLLLISDFGKVGGTEFEPDFGVTDGFGVVAHQVLLVGEEEFFREWGAGGWVEQPGFDDVAVVGHFEVFVDTLINFLEETLKQLKKSEKFRK